MEALWKALMLVFRVVSMTFQFYDFFTMKTNFFLTSGPGASQWHAEHAEHAEEIDKKPKNTTKIVEFT